MKSIVPAGTVPVRLVTPPVKLGSRNQTLPLCPLRVGQAVGRGVKRDDPDAGRARTGGELGQRLGFQRPNRRIVTRASDQHEEECEADDKTQARHDRPP